MIEHERMNREKKKELEKESRSRKKAELQYDQFKAADEGIADLIGGPSVDRHAALLAAAHSDEQRANLVMQLQQSYGNAYVQRLLNSKVFQTKLTVSQPGDVYEQEADRVAEMIQLQAEPEEEEEEEQEEEVQTQPAEEEEELQAQRQAEEEEEEEEEVQAQPAEEEEELQAQRQAEEEEEQEEEVQTQPAESRPTVVPENLETRINNARNIGQPMSESARASFEPQFGVDFSDVRIHTGSEANRLSQQLGAKAFTTGGDVFFREGAYQPDSESGKRLLAHELTHVVQQRGGQLHGDVQGQTETEIARNLISKSPSDVIQRNDDLLDPEIWKDKSAIEGVSRSWKLRAIDKSVSKYNSVKDEDVDTRIAALEKITTAIENWKKSKGKGESYKESQRWEWVEKLQKQAQDAWLDATIEKKQEAERAAADESIDEILEGVDRSAPDKVALASTAFQKFITWCGSKGVTYRTHNVSTDPLVVKGGTAYCEGLALSLVKVFQSCHIADAQVYELPQEWFTTHPLPNFIDQTTNGNLKEAGSDYGAVGRRFFFNKHWVTKANGGTIYDPTSGEMGAAATGKIDQDGFTKGKKKINEEDVDAFVKDSDWIKIIKGDSEVTCGVDGYEYHKGQT
jgi:hypothetical protein